MGEQTGDSIEAYRAIYKKLDRIWAICSKACGLSDAEYWALFMIREECTTQAAICEELSMNKQTIHSALKQLIKKGLVRLETKEDNRRIKRIVLTEAGIRFVEKHVDWALHAEERAWTGLKKEEQEQLIRTSQRYNRLLEAELRDTLHNRDS